MCAPKATTILSLVSGAPCGSSSEARSFLTLCPTGISNLDELLKGGLRVGSITEIFGKAGTGKTQLAMQICVETAKQGKMAAYIETERKFSLERLEEIALSNVQIPSSSANEYVHERAQFLANVPIEKRQEAFDILSRILLYSATDIEELRNVLSSVEVEACARLDNDDNGTRRDPPFGVLVVDSIASPVRRDFGKGDVASRAQVLMDFVKSLKRIAETLGLAVVVINHIGGATFQQGIDEDSVVDTAGALGNSWHHCASTRLLIENEEFETPSPNQSRREITVTKSCMLRKGCSVNVNLSATGFANSF